MKSFLSRILLTLILTLTSANLIWATEPTNTVRIEDDTSFAYPDGKSDEIAAYLQKKYVDDKTFINNLNKKYHLNVTSAYSDEYFTDVYFDTPRLDLMARKAGLRHRIRQLAGAIEPEKAIIQLKISDDDKITDKDNAGSRNEIKFSVKKSAPKNGFDQPLNLVTDKEKT